MLRVNGRLTFPQQRAQPFVLPSQPRQLRAQFQRLRVEAVVLQSSVNKSLRGDGIATLLCEAPPADPERRLCLGDTGSFRLRCKWHGFSCSRHHIQFVELILV